MVILECQLASPVMKLRQILARLETPEYHALLILLKSLCPVDELALHKCIRIFQQKRTVTLAHEAFIPSDRTKWPFGYCEVTGLQTSTEHQ